MLLYPPKVLKYRTVQVPAIGYGIVKRVRDDINEVDISELRKGDKIINSYDEISKVLCVVKVPVNEYVHLFDIKGVKATEKQMVNINGVWNSFGNIGEIQLCYQDFIYGLVLSDDRILTIDNLDIWPLNYNDDVMSKVASCGGFESGFLIWDIKE